MRPSTTTIFGLLIAAVFTFSSCKKTETFQTDALTDFMPLQVGKYIVYRLDSTVFLNFGKREETHAYQVKLEVNAEVTDNLGRPAFRIYRYIRDSAGTKSWSPDNTYLATPLFDQIEFTDDNLRFIKLHGPVKNGFNWKGNKYLPEDVYSSFYIFSNDDAMSDWDYYYDGETQATETIENQIYSEVITVQQDDEAYNYPIVDESSYAARNYSIEKFSKGIGMVYKELVLWEQQPNPTLVSAGPPPAYTYDPSKSGFGIRMWMIDHN